MGDTLPSPPYPGIAAAYFRLSARQAASECNWSLAAKQMRQAIEVYPSNGGALAKLDLANMAEKLATYERIAGEQGAAEDLTPAGIQFVIPGAERMQPAGLVQLDLF
jgi:hypothetical protein